MHCGALAPRDGIGRGIEPLKGVGSALVPPITAIVRVRREPLEPSERKYEKRRVKNIIAGPVPGPFPGAGRDEDTEALGRVTDCTTEEQIRRWIALAMRGSRKTANER